MMFHGDYEEALDNRELRNSACPVDIRVGDLVKPKNKWINGSLGIVTDIYKMTHDLHDVSWWCCKIYIDGEERALPIEDFELVKRGNKD